MFYLKDGRSVLLLICLSLLFLKAFSQSKLASLLPELEEVIEKSK